jgi:hypothetical protein
MTTSVETLKMALNEANPNKLADALAQVKLGTILDPVQPGEVTFATVQDHVDLDPPALMVQSCRVTDTSGGTGATGIRAIGDSACTPSATLAKLSGSGALITFEGTVKKVIVTYLARPTKALSEEFAESSS